MSGVSVTLNGQPVEAQEGQTVAGLLLSLGQNNLFHASEYNLVRSFYCGMGMCHQCLVTVNGQWNVRACITEVAPNMEIQTQVEGNICGS
ncbi:MAG: (2Fe-2S)-binding protein [Deinococcota bacterium]